MAAKDRIGKASEAARAAHRHRYVQRLLQDQELRGNLATAYGAARSAYGRMGNGKPATKVLMEDKKLQRELKQAIDALKDASSALGESPKRAPRGRGLGMVLLVAVGGVLALALSESLRTKVLDMIFGSEEEFDYTPDSTNSSEETPSTVTAQESSS